jgi:predicted MFS family arabinose efflux permease
MADDAYRRRVMALYTVAFLGSAPIGGPSMGYVVQALGPRTAIVVGAGACMAAMLLDRQRTMESPRL